MEFSIYFHPFVVHNTSARFDILKGQIGILALFYFCLSCVGSYYLLPSKIPQEKLPQILFGLFLDGVVGNRIDRTVGGYAIDFLDRADLLGV